MIFLYSVSLLGRYFTTSKEKRGDMVFGFPWCVMRGSEFLWAQLLLQFLTDPFETLQMFSSWSEDMHVLFTESLKFFFFSLFSHFNLDFFAWFWVCSGNFVSATPPTVLYRSFWNFTGILIMVWRYACAFLQNLEVIFFKFFTFLT